MKRREFVQFSSVAFCAAPVLTSMVFRSTEKVLIKPDWLLRLINANDSQLDRLGKYRVSDVKSPAYGGFLDAAEIPNAHSTVAYIRTAGSALASLESRHYRSE